MPFLRSLGWHFRCAGVALKPALAPAVFVQFVTKLGMSNLGERLDQGTQYGEVPDVSKCITSTFFTKGARTISASTRASGSAQPGWIYTRIPDSTQDTASRAVISLLRYWSVQDMGCGPVRQLRFQLSPCRRRSRVRDPAPRSKWQDGRTCRASPAIRARRRSRPDAPVRHVSADTPTGFRAPGRSSKPPG